MASIFKSLSPYDISIVPFPAYYKYAYSYTSGSTTNSPEIEISYGERYIQSFASASGLRVPDIKYELFDSVKQTFYSPIPYTAYATTQKSFIPYSAVYVVSVPQTVFGENILPGSFSVELNTSKSYDDGKGNLIVSSSGTGSVIGRIFYDKGIALLRVSGSQGYENLNPDPEWENEAPYPNGWAFLTARKLTSELTAADGVVDAFPGQEIYAAKIESREGAYITSSVFYSMPVTPGEIYKVYGWVYANGTTWRGIKNNGIRGSDDSLGYQIQFKNSSQEVVAYDYAITPSYYTKEEYTNNPDSYQGPVGWNFVSRQVTIPPGISYIAVAPFTDGPWPLIYDEFGNSIFGSPVCSPADKIRGCPGYAWFAGLTVQKEFPTTTAITSEGMGIGGLYIKSGSTVTINFSSSVKFYENTFKATLQPTDFIFCPNNPTVNNKLSGSNNKPIDLMASGSLLPYVTTLGFYNDKNELLLVAKTSVPIQRTKDVPQTFIVKFDI